jgi:hypothetical protein
MDKLGEVTLELFGMEEKWLRTVENFDGRASLRAEEEF